MRNKIKRGFVVFLTMTIASFFAFTISYAKDWTLKLSHGDAESPNPTHQTSLKFKELVEKYTKGGVKVVIYANNALGNEQEVAQAVRQGNIEGEILATTNLQPLAPSIGVLQLPYLFGGHEESWKTITATLPEIRSRVLQESGVRIVAIYEKGFRVMSNSKKPVEVLADLQGLKIRTSKSKAPIETFKAWGLEVIPMAWDEVFSALQQKVIDGQENPYTTLVTSKFFEVQKYVTEIHYTLWTGPLIISEKWFQQLPAEYQEAITKAGAESATFEWKYSTDMIVGTKKDLVGKYNMVLSGPPKDEEIWKEKAMSIWPSFYNDFGGEEWVKKFLEIKAEATK
jgi:tripartite ATP-independent transporter DctP family solute receptor